jgi:hypothetical protein
VYVRTSNLDLSWVTRDFDRGGRARRCARDAGMRDALWAIEYARHLDQGMRSAALLLERQDGVSTDGTELEIGVSLDSTLEKRNLHCADRRPQGQGQGQSLGVVTYRTLLVSLVEVLRSFTTLVASRSTASTEESLAIEALCSGTQPLPGATGATALSLL